VNPSRTLAKNGFVPNGPAGLSGTPGAGYERGLTQADSGCLPYHAWSALFLVSAG
jgi:hypothetical protein